MTLPIADHHRKYHPSPFTPFQEGAGGLEIMSDPRVYRPPWNTMLLLCTGAELFFFFLNDYISIPVAITC